MQADHEFALFCEDESGPLFREFCDDFHEAKLKAQELADLEGYPFLIFSFKDVRQVGRFKPQPKGQDA